MKLLIKNMNKDDIGKVIDIKYNIEAWMGKNAYVDIKSIEKNIMALDFKI